MHYRRRRSTRSRQANSGTIPSSQEPRYAAFLTPQPLPEWVPKGEGPLLVIMGGSQGAVGLSRMVRAITEPPGAGVPGGASHRGNRPRATCCTTRTLPNAALAMRSRACCNMPPGHWSSRCQEPQRTLRLRNPCCAGALPPSGRSPSRCECSLCRVIWCRSNRASARSKPPRSLQHDRTTSWSAPWPPLRRTQPAPANATGNGTTC